MALVPLTGLLADALAGGYAVGYFEAWDGYSLEAVLEAAEAERAPVILGFGCLLVDQGWLDAGGIETLACLGRGAAERSRVPVSLLLNEAHTLEHALRGVEAGFNAVMLCSSEVETVSRLVREAHGRGVAVEGELGALPDAVGDEIDASRASLTDPERGRRLRRGHRRRLPRRLLRQRPRARGAHRGGRPRAARRRAPARRGAARRPRRHELPGRGGRGRDRARRGEVQRRHRAQAGIPRRADGGRRVRPRPSASPHDLLGSHGPDDLLGAGKKRMIEVVRDLHPTLRKQRPCRLTPLELYRAHAPHPPLRGARLPPLPRGRDPRDDAPVPGAGGGRGRRLRRARAHRLDHLDAPAARARAREGRERARGDGGAVRQGDRLLPRPRRLHAPRRPGRRHAPRDRHRRGRQHRRHRPRARLQAPPQRPGRRLLLRRGSGERGRLPRGPQLRRRPAAAGRLRLREQPLRRLDAVRARVASRRRRRARGGLRRSGAHRRRDGRARRAGGDGGSGRRRARGRRADAARVQDVPLRRPQPQRRARLPDAGGGRGVEGARPDRAPAHAARRERRRRGSRPQSRRSSTTPSSSHAARPTPTPRRCSGDVYA